MTVNLPRHCAQFGLAHYKRPSAPLRPAGFWALGKPLRHNNLQKMGLAPRNSNIGAKT